MQKHWNNNHRANHTDPEVSGALYIQTAMGENRKIFYALSFA